MPEMQIVLTCDSEFFEDPDVNADHVKSLLGDEAYRQFAKIIEGLPAPCTTCGLRRDRCGSLGCV